MNEAIKRAIDIADSGLKWPEHKDFARAYIALERVYSILKGIDVTETRKVTMKSILSDLDKALR